MIKQIIEAEIKKMLGVTDGTHDTNEGKMKIVILNRGWVAVGKFTRSGDMCRLTDASVIRQWGTSKGLGQLALEGPQENTKLDPIAPLEFHILTTVGIMDAKKWI